MGHKLNQLQNLRIDAAAKRQKIVAAVEVRGDQNLTEAETRRFDELTSVINDLDEQIVQAKFDEKRALPAKLPGQTDNGRAWAQQTATELRGLTGESRGIASGSIDVPSLIQPNVTAMPRPRRLIDLLINREQLDSTAFEYFRQSTRTTAATAVADLAQKPTSTYTITPVTDRARVLAHLSQPAPIRLFQDSATVVGWLENEMVQGVYDALEWQAISGNGTSDSDTEDMTGLLHIGGTTAVPYTTDLPTTLRSARTALETIGAINGVDGDGNVAWVLNPADAQAIDLLRYSVTFNPADSETSELGFLVDGYSNNNANSANIFGDYPRVTCTSVPAGTAILGDWSQLKVMVRQDMSLMVDASGALFQVNAFVMRGEMRVGLAHLMPERFAIIDLTA